MLSSPDTLHVLIARFAYMAWSTASESTVLGLADLVRSSRFFQPVRNFLNHQVTVLWIIVPSYFAQQMFLVVSVVQFKLVKHQFLDETRFHVYLYGFQITQGVKQCTTCHRINYHDTTFNGLNCFSLMIYILQTNTYQDIAKLLTHYRVKKFPAPVTNCQQSKLIKLTSHLSLDSHF